MGTASTGTSANRSPFKRAKFGSPIRIAVSAFFIAAGIATASPVFAGTERGSQNMADTSDAALAASLPGDFRNGYAEVNGTRIHYVEGGKGTPVLLLPGWPQTWWEFHKIMPELAKRHRVIAVDLRGMGGSAKPGLGTAPGPTNSVFSREARSSTIAFQLPVMVLSNCESPRTNKKRTTSPRQARSAA